MEDERWEAGMPALDRQGVPGSVASGPPPFVPETEPTPLRRHYVTLSAIALVCGVVAITLLELGAGIGNPVVRLAILVGAPIVVVTTADAALRIWRSAWAWMPVDRGRGLFRLTWLVAAGLLVALAIGAFVLAVAG
jgi:hypothetical protein